MGMTTDSTRVLTPPPLTPDLSLLCVQVFGFPIARLDSLSDTGMLSSLNTLYRSFDVLNENKMDWRCFLFMVSPGFRV